VTAAALTVRGLSVAYGSQPGSVPVLGPLDLALAPGERLAVVGESGCGKSTLLHVLAGLLVPRAGEVLVDGEVVATAGNDVAGHPGARAGHSAYMFQRDLLLPWKTVLANAAFAAEIAGRARPGGLGPAEAKARAQAVLEEVGLGDVLEALPRQLSGGMRQRVALARTLVLGAGLVLLDEPFGSLDTLTRAELQGWLLDVMASHPATWVLVTHDVREAVLLGDRVAVLAGRPAGLEGWISVTLSHEERRALAGLEAGEGTGEADHGAGEELRALTAEVRGYLARRRAVR